MGMKEWYMDRTVKSMSAQEKKSMMSTMMDKFFDSMTAEEKKEMMNAMMPQMMDRMLGGMSPEDKMELMGTMMPRMMAQMLGGGELTPEMMKRMPACGQAADVEAGASGPLADIKPWECCPCRNFCEQGRKSAKMEPAQPSL
jgi:type II secretory pathway component PulF